MIPTDILELFENGETFYDFDTEDSMDNIQSLQFFLDFLDADSYVSHFDGTQCFLTHSAFDFELQLDSGGRGDFYSHVIKITKINNI